MAMMAKNLLWSCAQIVAPRPPINPQRPNETDAPNPAMTLLFHIQHDWRGVGDPCRSRVNSMNEAVSLAGAETTARPKAAGSGLVPFFVLTFITTWAIDAALPFFPSLRTVLALVL